ncbi:uncharacterized protein G2W53_011513 [Senna tora]|uniref:Uncharacterized protein n=1 Tax=Senna tora TaxID=362788 RepID=A0A835CB92_9FABA|nr:uncharacterized protein G2W53_011513 [Senna tora]
MVSGNCTNSTVYDMGVVGRSETGTRNIAVVSAFHSVWVLCTLQTFENEWYSRFVLFEPDAVDVVFAILDPNQAHHRPGIHEKRTRKSTTTFIFSSQFSPVEFENPNFLSSGNDYNLYIFLQYPRQGFREKKEINRDCKLCGISTPIVQTSILPDFHSNSTVNSITFFHYGYLRPKVPTISSGTTSI